jgi:4-amino-4-deoxy-L-arabinose transferase-like glycosyltransferase
VSHRPLPAARFYAWLLFAIALIPRLPGLARFITTDESYFMTAAGSQVIAAFLQGQWRATYWHFYPGVIISWLEGLGMAGQYLWLTLFGSPPPFANYLTGDIVARLAAVRLPFALLTAAAIPVIYTLARQLLPQRVALLGALLLALDPFFAAHSRVAHGDGPVTVFMAVSALAFFVFARRITESPARRSRIFGVSPSAGYLILSAGAGGLAALTKAPGQLMALFVVGMGAIYAATELWAARNTQYATSVFKRWLTVISVWGLVSLAVFILFWPSMWVDPLGTLRQMLTETFTKVDAGHLVYFMGRATLNPGPWFYPVVIPLRMTPITLIGSLLSMALLIPPVRSKLKISDSFAHTIALLWLFTLALLLFGNLSPKKQDRYLLPLFPFLDLLAAAGWVGLIANGKLQIANGKWQIIIYDLRFTIYELLFATLLVLHALPLVTYYPYYLTYFNPLLGGPKQAVQTTLVGWGEGMEQVAAYLNVKPNVDRLYVATSPSQTLLPYFKGTGENFYTNDIAFRADYVVLYLPQMQRLAPSPEIVRYFEAQTPEKVITIQGVAYAKIYASQKQILADIPPAAIPANIGLDNQFRLAGYNITLPDTKTQTLALTLYWHALAPIATDYTISVRARAAGGSLLAQRDSWPINGLLPTSQWRQGDYVADPHTLNLPPEQINRLDHIEIVVYNASTGQTLGAPIQLGVTQLGI